MLDLLHRIVSEVNAAADLQAALQAIVRGVRSAIKTDVCSVYLADFERRCHVLMATEGLRKESVSKVRLPFGRGLVGLVAERAEPVNVADAPSHPRYMALVETGEQRYRGFLGVPIIQHRQVHGVLVVRQEETREFSEGEVTFLFTLAAQLAGAISQARASGELERVSSEERDVARFLAGRPGSSGVALGRAVVVYRLADLDAVPERVADDPVVEENRFRAAVTVVESELRSLKDRLGDALPAEDRALFDALLLMLGSDTLVTQTIAYIRGGQWAPGALRQSTEEHAQVFEQMDDVYLRERASDIRDLGRRILTHLQGEVEKPIDYPDATILVGHEVSAMDLAKVPRERLVGIASATGSSTSHVAIFARALGVPAVMGLTDLPVGRIDDRDLIIDGYRGRLYISPTESVSEEYQRLAHEERELSAGLETLRGKPSETTDGVHLPLLLNTGLVTEMNTLGREEAEGVGLYRSELPFMVRDRFPAESVQVNNYREVLEAFVPRPVIIRTLDIGGDKPLPYFPVQEQNPFLGWRGVRISLDHPEIFLTQIRAMLRADIGLNNLQIMLPMVSDVREVDELIRLITRAHDELLEEEHAVRMPPIGVMIEVPSAVYQSAAIARRVDFLSVGTNDLTQYLLAVDRNNTAVADNYDDFHPAVLRALAQIIEGAAEYGKPVGVCGEMAGNPLGTKILLGLGFNSLSMSAGSLLRVKAVVRSCSAEDARQCAKAVLGMEDAEQVRRYMQNAIERLGLSGLVRPGK